MYQYVYDNCLSDKRHAKVIAELENRLTDLGIHGRIDRMHPLKSLRECIEDGIKKGVKTVIAVGNDETFKKLLDIIPGKDLVLGYVPIGGGSIFARILGIPEGVAACDVLSARLTETLDIGRVNGQYFLTAVSFSAKNVEVECEGKYRVELLRGGRVTVCNIASMDGDAPGHIADPFDGFLDAVLAPAQGGGFFRKTGTGTQSVLKLRRIVARSKDPFTLIADGRELAQQTVEIDIAKEQVRIIIGKNRIFASRRSI